MNDGFSRAELQQLGYEERGAGNWVKVAAPPRVDAATESSPRKAAAPASPYRSKWEAERADWWEQHKRGGIIRDWRYEPLRLRLADGAYYKPDFLVVHEDGSMSLEEVKGFWREAALVRFKVARELYPMFTFNAVTKRDHRWVDALWGARR